MVAHNDRYEARNDLRNTVKHTVSGQRGLGPVASALPASGRPTGLIQDTENGHLGPVRYREARYSKREGVPGRPRVPGRAWEVPGRYLFRRPGHGF